MSTIEILDRFGNSIKNWYDEIPKTFTHDLAFLDIDPREACDCKTCTALKLRRDSIFKNKWYYKIFKKKTKGIPNKDVIPPPPEPTIMELEECLKRQLRNHGYGITYRKTI